MKIFTIFIWGLTLSVVGVGYWYRSTYPSTHAEMEDYALMNAMSVLGYSHCLIINVPLIFVI